MAACQALDIKSRQHGLGKGTQPAYEAFRKSVSFIENDKDIEIYDELNKATDVLVNGDLLNAVENTVDLDIQFK